MQFRYALLRAVERLSSGDLNWQVSIEAGDDVEVVPAPGYSDLHQLKLRAPGTTLTDSSRDLWKTFRIWAEGSINGTIDLFTTQLFLVTTSTAPAGSVADILSPQGTRDMSAACKLLDASAASSSSKDNESSYIAWNRLSYATKISLLERVTVIPQTPDIDEIKELLEDACRLSVRRAYVPSFVVRLEGWWFQQCINILRSDTAQFVRGEDFDAIYSDIRDSFLPENLPIDTDVSALSPNIDPFANYLFVKQIQLVGTAESRMASAIRDYLRASTQRSRWVRESLIGPIELPNYERKLTEEWRYVFDRLKDDLPNKPSEDANSRMARDVYKWVEEGSAPPIRNQCTELFLVRGSLHMLADRPDSGVGWHPEFETRLIATPTSQSA